MPQSVFYLPEFTDGLPEEEKEAPQYASHIEAVTAVRTWFEEKRINNKNLRIVCFDSNIVREKSVTTADTKYTVTATLILES